MKALITAAEKVLDQHTEATTSLVALETLLCGEFSRDELIEACKNVLVQHTEGTSSLIKLEDLITGNLSQQITELLNCAQVAVNNGRSEEAQRHIADANELIDLID